MLATLSFPATVSCASEIEGRDMRQEMHVVVDEVSRSLRPGALTVSVDFGSNKGQLRVCQYFFCALNAGWWGRDHDWGGTYGLGSHSGPSEKRLLVMKTILWLETEVGCGGPSVGLGLWAN